MDDRSESAAALDDAPRKKTLAVIVIPSLVLVGLLAWGFLTSAGESPKRAPSFELTALDGGTIASEDLEGRPLVLNFWASWCVPCRQEMPAFQRMWDKYSDDGVQIVGVNVQDSAEGARAFVKELGITYPVGIDEGSLSNDLHVTGLPQTFFIDSNFEFERPAHGAASKDGSRVVFGAISEEELQRRIEELLESD